MFAGTAAQLFVRQSFFVILLVTFCNILFNFSGMESFFIICAGLHKKIPASFTKSGAGCAILLINDLYHSRKEFRFHESAHRPPVFPQKDDPLSAGPAGPHRDHRAHLQGSLDRDHRRAGPAFRLAGGAGAGAGPAAPSATWSRWARVRCPSRPGICTGAVCPPEKAWA